METSKNADFEPLRHELTVLAASCGGFSDRLASI